MSVLICALVFWHVMSLDPSVWYIDPKHTFPQIVKGNLHCLLVYNYSLMYLDLVFYVRVLKLLLSTVRQTELYSVKYLLS